MFLNPLIAIWLNDVQKIKPSFMLPTYFIDISLLVVSIKCQYCNNRSSDNTDRPSSVTVFSVYKSICIYKSIIIIFCLIHAITKINDYS